MLRELLEQRTLVKGVQTLDELEARVDSQQPMNLMMGQTFDGGQPVDMMKYALFLMQLSSALETQGIEVSSNWLIADHFIVDLNQDQGAQEAREDARKRVEYLTRLNEVYGGSVGFVLSSELSKSDEYRENLRILIEQAEVDPRFRELVLRAVPADKRSRPNALRYPFEELATIQTMDTHVKVGPPYEVFYDEPAREFAPVVGFNKYVAIQLTPSLPFASPHMGANTREQVEQFGVLPYKRGSKGLAAYRIDPLNDSFEDVRKLVAQTRDARALVDLIIIGEMAQTRLEGNVSTSFFASKGKHLYSSATDDGFEDPNISQDLHLGVLRDLATGLYEKYIHKPLRDE